RYALRGDPADLDRAVDLDEAALARTPTDSPDRPMRLGNLAIYLSTRYALRGDPADLDRAVDLDEAALARTPTDSPDLPGRLGNLAIRLSTRYALRGDPADLDRAVDLEEAAWGLVRTSATGLGAIDVAWGLASRLRARDVAYGQVGASAAQQADTLSAGVATLDSILARAGLADDRAADTLLDRYGHLHAWRVEALLRLATDAQERGDDDAARQRVGEAYEAVALAKGRRLSARLHAGALAPTGAAATLAAELDRLAAELDRLDQQLGGTDTGPDADLGPPTGSWLGERATPVGTVAPDRYRGSRARHAPFDDRTTDLTPQRTARLAALRAELLARQTSLLNEIQALDPRWATARGTVTPPSVNEVAAALPPGGVAMLLFPTPDTTAVVTVRRADNDGDSHDPTVTVDSLPWPAGKVGAVELAISSPRDGPIPDGDDLERLLRDLGGDLGLVIARTLGPLTTPNRRPSLVLMPTGTLHRVPFHAIPWMADGTTWDGTTRLADVARVSYVATPDVLVLRAREAARGLDLGEPAENHETAPAGPEVARTTLAAVAPGVADASGGQVPDLTVALAHATAQLVPSESRARVTTRARATRHALLGQAALAGVGLALVATHGRAGEETGGRQSGLLLHADHGALPEVGQADLGDARGTGPQGTWVTAREMLARLPLEGTRHVQLLACETHADSPAPGDELAGLVSTFLIR
ncbi:MAG: CHAT domain-containing protein, partial [Chloroflexi bacterium]|nr:CHAT domain-containing protein [Chloroflexota bacterium]